MSVFNTIRIDSNTIYKGNDFTLQREYIYAGEYETCTGKRIADVVGWRYADTTIEWDTLPQDMLSYILHLTGKRVIFSFKNEYDVTIYEYVIPQVISSQATRFTDPTTGKPVWKNIQLQLRFVEAHNT